MAVEILLTGGPADNQRFNLFGPDVAPERFTVVPSPVSGQQWIHVPEEDAWPAAVTYVSDTEIWERIDAPAPVMYYVPAGAA